MSKLTEQVYRHMRRQIMSGNWAPGAQIKEEHMASELGVSRSPVRAAFQRLIEDGLLISHRSRGAFVAEWTDRDIDEIFELRILLESHAAGLAAVNASAEQIAVLHSATETMQRFARQKPLNYLGDMQAANSLFHRVILEASGSPRLRALATTLVDIPMVVGAFYLYSDADIQRSIQHHLDLLEAIGQRDRDLAQRIMSIHLRMAYLAFMRSRQVTGTERGDQSVASFVLSETEPHPDDPEAAVTFGPDASCGDRNAD